MTATTSPGRTGLPGPVGFVGLGNLGRPMATALANAGWSVGAFDLDGSRAAGLPPTVQRAGALSELARCPVVAIVVTDDAAVTGVVDTLMPDLAPGSLLIVHSTVLPETARSLAGKAAEAGVDLVDAPVSGGAERAATGDLTTMVGGSAGAFEATRPELETVSSNVHHVGPAGAGEAAKLANQLMMFAALGGIYEAFDLAGAHEVATDQLLEVIRTCTGDSWCARTWGFFDEVAAAYDAAGTPRSVRPWHKDMRDILEVAESKGLTLPLAGLLSETVPERLEGAG